MVRCELCGREIRGLAYKVIVDRAELIVCPSCARGRHVVETIDFSRPYRGRRKMPQIRRRPRRSEVIEEVVEDYAKIIREARQKMGLTRDVLATMVGEKESTIRRIEAGKLQPTITLARKLEKVLKVKLVEVYEEEDFSWGGESGSGYELTLGDIAEFKD